MESGGCRTGRRLGCRWEGGWYVVGKAKIRHLGHTGEYKNEQRYWKSCFDAQTTTWFVPFL